MVECLDPWFRWPQGCRLLAVAICMVMMVAQVVVRMGVGLTPIACMHVLQDGLGRHSEY
jgi:hypothetical protein